MAWTDSLGGISSTAMSWMTTTAFWIFLLLILTVFFIGVLWIRKKRKFTRLVLEHFDLGNGNFDWRLTKGGWFRNRFTLFGLWDYGTEQRFRLKDMTPVDNVSHRDYRLFNGKPAIAVIRNPKDARVVFPISKYYLSKDSKAIMAEVAPADYRDTAVKAIEEADKEMQSKWAQYAPIIVTGVVIIISLIITLLNTQYGKYMVDQATKVLLEIKSTPCGSGLVNAVPSTAP